MLDLLLFIILVILVVWLVKRFTLRRQIIGGVSNLIGGRRRSHDIKSYEFSNDIIGSGNSNPKLHVQDPWLQFIQEGKKTVEGRRGNKERFSSWIGKEAIFFNKERSVRVLIKDVRCYSDLYQYLDNEGWDKVLPGVKSRDAAIETYHQWYSDEQIEYSGGMCGIEVEVM